MCRCVGERKRGGKSCQHSFESLKHTVLERRRWRIWTRVSKLEDRHDIITRHLTDSDDTIFNERLWFQRENLLCLIIIFIYTETVRETRQTLWCQEFPSSCQLTPFLTINHIAYIIYHTYSEVWYIIVIIINITERGREGGREEWLILPQTGINLCIDFRFLFYFTKETTVFFVQTFSFLPSCACKPWNRGEEELEPCYFNKLAYQKSLVWACERHPSTIASPCSASLLHTSLPADP